MFTVSEKITVHLAHRDHTSSDGTLHGHSSNIEILFDAHLGQTKDLLKHIRSVVEKLLNHRFLVCFDDPLFSYLVLRGVKQITGVDAVVKLYMEYNGGTYPNEQVGFVSVGETNHPIAEFINGTTVVNFPTTNENLAKWLFHLAKRLTDTYNKEYKTASKLIEVKYEDELGSIATYTE